MQKLRTRNKPRGRCTKCILGTFVYIVVLLLLLFIIVFVIVPVVFKYSIGIQRNIIFPSWVIPPMNYSDIEASGIKGVKNFYVSLSGENNVTSDNNVTLGVWQILPYDILSDLINNDDYNYEGVLANGNYSILLYLHGNGADRAAAVDLYDILRKYFHVIAVDYRDVYMVGLGFKQISVICFRRSH